MFSIDKYQLNSSNKIFMLPTSESRWVTNSAVFVGIRSQLTGIEQRVRLPLKWSWSPKVKGTWGLALISLHLKLN